MVIVSIADQHFDSHPHHKKVRHDLVTRWKQDNWLQEAVTTLVVVHNNGLADIVAYKGNELTVMR